MGCETLFYSWFDHSDSSAEHLLRFMESLLDPFSGLRFVTTCHTRAFFPSSFPYSSAFKATIISSVWRSEPLSLCISGIQSHYLSIIWRSEPSLHNCGIQSHHSRSSVWYSKPLVSLAFRLVHNLAFRAISQLGIQGHWSVWCLKPSFSSAV